MPHDKIMRDSAKTKGRALLLFGGAVEADAAVVRSFRAAGIDPATIVLADANAAKTLRDLLLRIADALDLTVSRNETMLSAAARIGSTMTRRGQTTVHLVDMYRTTKLSTASTHADFLCAELFRLLQHWGISLIVGRQLGPIGIGEIIMEREFRMVRVEELSAGDVRYLLGGLW
ncbi:MAG: hypothetical protein CFE29_08890 [Bradyrhizobiaceae bacterium PARB1]|jgi:hypothetical protein|nr:MAG: hypothetical protein CFE29_08890 [Bradyrhizobiaceae bacterium PARB1]